MQPFFSNLRRGSGTLCRGLSPWQPLLNATCYATVAGMSNALISNVPEQNSTLRWMSCACLSWWGLSWIAVVCIPWGNWFVDEHCQCNKRQCPQGSGSKSLLDVNITIFEWIIKASPLSQVQLGPLYSHSPVVSTGSGRSTSHEVQSIDLHGLQVSMGLSPFLRCHKRHQLISCL